MSSLWLNWSTDNGAFVGFVDCVGPSFTNWTKASSPAAASYDASSEDLSVVVGPEDCCDILVTFEEGWCLGPLARLGDGNPFVGDDGNDEGFNISSIKNIDSLSDLNSRHSTSGTARIAEIVRKINLMLARGQLAFEGRLRWALIVIMLFCFLGMGVSKIPHPCAVQYTALWIVDLKKTAAHEADHLQGQPPPLLYSVQRATNV